MNSSNSPLCHNERCEHPRTNHGREIYEFSITACMACPCMEFVAVEQNPYNSHEHNLEDCRNPYECNGTHIIKGNPNEILKTKMEDSQ
jgi:hypothetical protein